MNCSISSLKDYQKDPWTSTIARATRVITAAIGKTLFLSWERHVSSCGSIMRTHNIWGFQQFQVKTIKGFISRSLSWMDIANPGPNRSFIPRIVMLVHVQCLVIKLVHGYKNSWTTNLRHHHASCSRHCDSPEHSRTTYMSPSFILYMSLGAESSRAFPATFPTGTRSMRIRRTRTTWPLPAWMR